MLSHADMTPGIFPKCLTGLTIAMAWGGAFAAELYKWVDEKGVVTYGEKPPANTRAIPVNTLPGAIVESSGQPVAKPNSEKRGGATPVAPPGPPSAAARGMEFDVYIRLQRGMTEGELLQRAGKPDHESVESIQRLVVKTYYYFPTASNPYTTVVTLRGGRIQEVDRVKRF